MRHLDRSCALLPWQAEDYRALSTEELFVRLGRHGIHWGIGELTSCADSYDTPEELADALVVGRSEEEGDQIYLLLFELWRRLFPEKQSLSLFCDELDSAFFAFEKGQPPKNLPDLIDYLLKILEENVDAGADPQETFALFQAHLASDLEEALYDYIRDNIDEGEIAYAAELIEGFMRFVDEPLWFSYLKARVLILQDPEEGYALIEQIAASKPSLDLLLELQAFLATSGNHTLFVSLATQLIPLLQTEEDFQDLLYWTHKHYTDLGIEEPAEISASLLNKRSGHALGRAFSKDDRDGEALKHLLAAKVHII